MKKPLYFLFAIIFLLLTIYFGGIRYLNSGSLTPDNTVWESYIGRDTTVGILPDKYANYYTYTLAHTKENLGFKIKGEFPDTRYFSFNVYSLGDNTTQGSLVDYQIQTDSGKPNPFLVNTDSVDAGNRFTVSLIPEKYKEKKLPNQLTFKNDTRLMAVAIRLYDYNVDDFGGVAFPTVEAFTIEDETDKGVNLSPTRLPTAFNLRSIVRRFSLPGMVERLGLVFQTEQIEQLDGTTQSAQVSAIPFHAIDTKGYIENNDNRYLLAGVTKKEDEIYLFKFKAPNHTTTADNINQTDVRYWSFNLGNAATYNFNGLKDEDAILDEQGFVHIVLADKNEALEERVAALGYNFMEWNMPWQRGLILFRHMLADPNFEAQIDDVTPIKDGSTNFEPMEAKLFMGDYAPQGIRMTQATFMNEYQSVVVEKPDNL